MTNHEQTKAAIMALPPTAKIVANTSIDCPDGREDCVVVHSRRTEVGTAADLKSYLAHLEGERDDLAMMVRRLLAYPNSDKLKEQARGYLKHINQQGSILREAALKEK